MLRRTEADVALPLPTISRHLLVAKLTRPQARAYEAAGRIRNDLVRAQQREQACGWADGRSSKVEAAVALLQARKDLAKVVMWSARLDHITLAGERLKAAGVLWVRVDGSDKLSARAEAIRRFQQEPDVRVLLGSDVLGSGLNLQHASALISLGSSWSPASERQREGRVRRIGSSHSRVEHFTIITDTPYELAKWERMQQRELDAACVLGGTRDLSA